MSCQRHRYQLKPPAATAYQPPRSLRFSTISVPNHPRRCLTSSPPRPCPCTNTTSSLPLPAPPPTPVIPDPHQSSHPLLCPSHVYISCPTPCLSHFVSTLARWHQGLMQYLATPRAEAFGIRLRVCGHRFRCRQCKHPDRARAVRQLHMLLPRDVSPVVGTDRGAEPEGFVVNDEGTRHRADDVTRRARADVVYVVSGPGFLLLDCGAHLSCNGLIRCLDERVNTDSLQGVWKLARMLMQDPR